MKHSNEGGILHGAHEYKNGTYQEVKDFKPSEYPKHVGSRVVKNADEEAALAPKPEAPKEV